MKIQIQIVVFWVLTLGTFKVKEYKFVCAGMKYWIDVQSILANMQPNDKSLH
jgi:hypothetical protein